MTEKPSRFADKEPQKPPATNKEAALKDQLRKTFLDGRVMMTRGVQSLGQEDVQKILVAVRNADHGDADDDHGEHDFGAVVVDGVKCFWKIDYYDNDLKYHSPDKSDPTVTQRVLTVMLADEY